MAVQIALFGGVKAKDKFFSAPITGSHSPSLYYQVIEALWKEEKKRSCKEFFPWAQQQWRDLYSLDEAARRELLAKNKGGANLSGS